MDSFSIAIAVSSFLALLGIVSSKLSTRIGIPVLLLFLGLGMLAGSDGIGGIDFTNAELAQSLGVIALALILFAGGLDTSWASVRSVARQSTVLAIFGVAVTAGIVGVFSAWILDIPIENGLLIGAIVSSTDAAAVFSVLRTQKIRLKGNLRSLLEVESGSNDPMAVFLTIGLLELILNETKTPLDLIPLFINQLVVGAAMGILGGFIGVWAMNRIRLSYEGLYPVFLLSIVGITYGLAASLNGSGFLAVYIVGLLASRANFIHKQSTIKFFDGVAWIGQIGMFVVLGLLVFPSDLPDVFTEGLLISLVLIFVARPIAIFLSLTPFRVPIRNQSLVAWVGLRGAAPIILATFPLMENIEGAETIFNLVFFVVIASVAVQGTSIPFVARCLGVAEPEPPKTKWPIEVGTTMVLNSELFEFTINENSTAVNKPIVELGLSPGSIIVLVERSGNFFVPTGSTILNFSDKLLVLSSPDGHDEIEALFGPGTKP